MILHLYFARRFHFMGFVLISALLLSLRFPIDMVNRRGNSSMLRNRLLGFRDDLCLNTREMI